MRRDLLIALLLVSLTLVVFAQVRGFGFVDLDDRDYVYGNEIVLGGLDGPGIVWAFTSTLHHWHPLTWVSLMLDSDLYRDGARGYHTTNLVLHVLNTLLVFGLFRRMTGAAGKSFFVAALFAVHPLHVEPVVWISSRKDVLSSLFGLLALHAYAGWVERKGWGRYLVLVLAYLASLLSKQMLVTFPFVLLLLDFWPLGRLGDWRRALIEKLPLFGVAAAFSVAAFLGLSGAGAVQPVRDFPYSLRPISAVLAYGHYLADTVWPRGLACFYPHPLADMPWGQVAAAAALLLGVSAFAFVERTRRPYFLTGWLWFLGTLVPVIGLIPTGTFQRADRYTYLPLIGIFAAVVWLAESGVPAGRLRSRFLPAAGVLILIALMIVSRAQVGRWRNSEMLYRHAIAVTRNNDLAHFNLGTYLGRSGRYQESVEHLTRAVELNPRNVDAYANLGNALRHVGDIEGAMDNLRRALELAPSMLAVHMNMGQILQQTGRNVEAIDSFRAGFDLAPQDPRVRDTLAVALYDQGRRSFELGDRQATIDYLDEALRVNPGMRAAREALDHVRAAGEP